MRLLQAFIALAAVCGGWLNRLRPNRKMSTRKLATAGDAICGGGRRKKLTRVTSNARDARHEFIPRSQRDKAYFDMALPIGDAQTISSPFIVAWMTEAIDPQPTDKVLEIGTGSGYQAAVLSSLAAEVYSIEIVRPLGEKAAEVLEDLGYKNVHVRVGDGFQGWPEHAPFDKIIVTCSPESVPQPLIDQLREGGQMIIPVGQRYQQTLYLLTKQDGKWFRRHCSLRCLCR